MPVTPTGPISLATSAHRDLIAACPEFQSVTGAANATAALEFVWHEQYDGYYNRPIYFCYPVRRTWDNPNRYHGGTIRGMFEMDINVAYLLVNEDLIADGDDAATIATKLATIKGKINDAFYDFQNHAGQLWKEIVALGDAQQSGGTYQNIVSCSEFQPPMRSDIANFQKGSNTLDNFYRVIWDWQYGLR
jgi:hypothetical protein